MILPLRRNRANRIKTQHFPSARRRLAFERLEECYLRSAEPTPSGLAGLLLPEQPGKDLPVASALPADANASVSLPGHNAIGNGAITAARNSGDTQSPARWVQLYGTGNIGQDNVNSLPAPPQNAGARLSQAPNGLKSSPPDQKGRGDTTSH